MAALGAAGERSAGTYLWFWAGAGYSCLGGMGLLGLER